MVGESWNVFRKTSGFCANYQTFVASCVKIQRRGRPPPPLAPSADAHAYEQVSALCAFFYSARFLFQKNYSALCSCFLNRKFSTYIFDKIRAMSDRKSLQNKSEISDLYLGNFHLHIGLNPV